MLDGVDKTFSGNVGMEGISADPIAQVSTHEDPVLRENAQLECEYSENGRSAVGYRGLFSWSTINLSRTVG